MIGVVVLIGLGLFIQVPILRVLSLAALVIVYLRLFSKNISKRMAENRKYLTILAKVKAPFQLTVKKIKTRKEYKYFKCPACKQQIRAPRNRGKISVTCRSCQHKFEEQT